MFRALLIALVIADVASWRPVPSALRPGAALTRPSLTELHAKKGGKGKKGKKKTAGLGKGLDGPAERSASQREQRVTVSAAEEDSDKLVLKYTCGVCGNDNLAKVSPVAYENGTVIVTCQHCGSRHLVADNKGLMDAGGFTNIEDYLGDKARRASAADLAGESLKVEEKADGSVDLVLEESTKVSVLPTAPIEGQKPGTSGLRKKVKVWQEGLYLHNFVQSIFSAFSADITNGGTLVLGGDGRYYSEEAVQTILRIAAANGVARVWVGLNGLLSTPAVSAIIRYREGGVAAGGIVLTASHNPGGPDEDFGIKFNNAEGSPAPEEATDRVYEATTTIREVRMVEGTADVDLSVKGTTLIGDMKVEVIDSTEDYVKLLEETFDMDKIAALLKREDFSFLFDAMHGASGPYAVRVFGDRLGVRGDALLRCDSRTDFGGSHPDPNLKYAAELVSRMGLEGDGSRSAAAADGAAVPDFGAASDGDGDRNMIVGRGCFVTPSDSLAVLADRAGECVPSIAARGGLKSVARSMPTSSAVDAVAAKKGLACFETPTGWRFFGNLLDAETIGGPDGIGKQTPLICGEESFGTGSDHVREKDGMWAVLAWLQVLAKANEGTEAGALVGVSDILEQHWATYGRHLYSRWDFEGVSSDGANAMYDHLRSLCGGSAAEQAPAAPEPTTADLFGALLDAVEGIEGAEVAASAADEEGPALLSVEDFSYEDPVDGSVSKNQGIVLKFEGGARVVFRLSGTGSAGATIRMYVERFDDSEAVRDAGLPATTVLRPLALKALDIAKVEEFTGVREPTVIT